MGKPQLIDEDDLQGVYHAGPRSFKRQENDLLDLIGMARSDKEAEAHKRRLMALRSRKRAKIRHIPKEGDNTVLRKLPRRDPIAGLSERYYRIAELLRDHAQGVSIGSLGEMIGFVDGGKSTLTGPEAFANKSRRGRIAWERFLEACIEAGCDESARECVKVLLQRKSFTACLCDLGIAPNKKPSSRQVDNFVAILANGLDEAGAYLGVN